MKFVELKPNLFVNIQHIIYIEVDNTQCHIGLIDKSEIAIDKTYQEVRAMILKAE